MPHKKRKCVNCKTKKPVEEGNIVPAGFICSGECAIEYSRKQFIKRNYLGNKGKRKNKTNKDARYDRKVREEAAKKACHAYIRERDKGKPCICCGDPITETSGYHAGHFYESNNYPYLRFDEDNISGQRGDCNFFKSQQAGQYRERLLQKIGEERLLRLDTLRHEPIIWDCDDLYRIERHYKQKLKDLLKSRQLN